MAEAANPFVFKGCVELREILGQRAEDEKQLADLLAQVPPGSVYYHTHGFFLRHRVFASTYTNDFAAWVVGEVRDPVLGEKLAMVDPLEFPDLEALREELVSVIDHMMSTPESPMSGMAVIETVVEGRMTSIGASSPSARSCAAAEEPPSHNAIAKRPEAVPRNRAVLRGESLTEPCRLPCRCIQGKAAGNQTHFRMSWCSGGPSH